ncbi:MAG: aldehyde dehydrogenase (NADP(+)) [Planctomycetes bacterium]|nr:aldehyde dehydrogenase (NADP(+)) [Planctomycetota bacterium]
MELHGRHLIADAPSADAADTTFTGVDPTTGDALSPPYCDATDAEVDRALAAAEAAHSQLIDLDRESRAKFLEAVADGIMGLGDALLERAGKETALPAARLTGERGRTCAQLRQFASVVRDGSHLEPRIDHALPDREPLPKPDVRQMHVPLGPVVVFGASNFPLAFSVAGGDTASALAAGCPIVVKGHPNHPGTSEMVGRVIQSAVRAAGLPAGTFSLVHGRGHAVGLAMVKNPRTRAVGFTGSLSGGRALIDAVATREDPIPVYAEMGSVNPVVILPGAASERGEAIANGLFGAVTLGVGQFCTNPGLVFALDDENTSALVHRLEALAADAPDGTFLHAGIRTGYRAGCDRLDAVDGVARSGRADGDGGPGGARATPAVYTTDAATFRDHPALAEEVFGPSTLVVRCPHRDDLTAALATLSGQLTATLHATDADLLGAGDLVALLRDCSGRLVLNGFPTGVEVCPSMHHGGPWPATSDVRTTSVGTAAVRRFLRPFCYQGFPQHLLPDELKDGNPLGIMRLVDGAWTDDA